MKRFILRLIPLILVGCGTAKNINIDNGILIENVTIVSANTQGVIETYKGYILTDQSKIVYCDRYKPKVKGSFKVIDGRDNYAIPGLIDSHVHLNNIAGLNFRQRATYEKLVEDYFKRLPKNFLYFGYTTLIDVDNYAPHTLKKLKAIHIRPEIYNCAQKVQVMNDFEMVMNETPQEMRYKSAFLHDKYNESIKYPDSLDFDKHSVDQIISNIAKENNICVKTLYEDASSGLPQVWELPTEQIIKELVTEAHKEGLKTIMHATSYKGQEFALNTGIDIIAHAMWNWTADPSAYLNTKLPETHRNVLLTIAKEQIGYQPTARVILAEKDILDDKFKNDKILEKLYTENYLQWLRSDEAQWSRKRILGRPKFLKKINPNFYNPIRNQFNSDKEMFVELYRLMELKIRKVMQLLSQNNANFLFSTDNGAMNMYTHPPGYNGYLEMQYWEKVGVPLEQIFKAATYNNAKEFGLLNNIGTLSLDKTANILLLKSNPLETIKAYNDIEFVIINGECIEREELESKYKSK